jgi:hypothetical protein
MRYLSETTVGMLTHVLLGVSFALELACLFSFILNKDDTLGVK